VTEDQVPVKIGGGPAMAVMEGSGQGLIMSKKLVDWIASLAKQNKLSLQFEVAEKGGSDASRMQYIKTGLLVASIGIPCRYTHSTNELISIKDVEDSGKLVKAIIEGFKEYK
jgi:endoglucanase